MHTALLDRGVASVKEVANASETVGLRDGGIRLATSSTDPVTNTCTASELSWRKKSSPRNVQTLPDPNNHMWTSSHEANAPSEDRHSSLVNILLRPSKPRSSCNIDDECCHSDSDEEGDEERLNDTELNSSLVRLSLWAVMDGHGGGSVANYASEVLLPLVASRVASALDCTIIDRGHCTVNGEKRDPDARELDELIRPSTLSITGLNRNKIFLRNPNSINYMTPSEDFDNEEENLDKRLSADSPTMVSEPFSCKNNKALPGTHSAEEIAAVKEALSESFLTIDEGWINSIDPIQTHQTSCRSNGWWNAGSCAIVTMAIQRLDCKECASSLSRVEIDTSSVEVSRQVSNYEILDPQIDDASKAETESSLSSSPVEPFDLPIQEYDCSSGHYYQAHEAMLYTAHVGDCRAVLLRSAPPLDSEAAEVTDPETDDGDISESSEDDSEATSSDDYSESSDEECDYAYPNWSVRTTYMSRPAKRMCRRPEQIERQSRSAPEGPFVPLPPLHPDSDNDTDNDDDSETSSVYNVGSPPVKVVCKFPIKDSKAADIFVPVTLTTDHSAENEAEADAVLRRCGNAPRAISSSVAGGIKRVAGSLAVTRALGDAYLKTPELSFLPYKRYAPYITARPEVTNRLITRSEDRFLVIGSDGVWERASGQNVMRWVRNYFEERQHKPSSRMGNSSMIDAKESQSRKRPLRSIMPRPGWNKLSQSSSDSDSQSPSTVSDMIVRRVLHKVRRVRNMPSVRSLMALPRGRARRSKHDDITASVVDLSGFIF